MCILFSFPFIQASMIYNDLSIKEKLNSVIIPDEVGPKNRIVLEKNKA